MRYLPFILLFALIVYALVDCVRYQGSSMPAGMPKGLWVVLIVVFPAAGAIAWLVVSRVHAHASAGRGAGTSYPRPPLQPRRRPVTRQVAPDDDPEFLASLDRPGRAEPPAGDAQDAAAQDAATGEQEPGPADREGDTEDEHDGDEGSAGRPGSPPAA